MKDTIESYVSGESAAKLTRDIGVHRHTMRSILDKAGIKKPFRILDQNQIDEVVALYKQGRSAATVGKELGVNPAAAGFTPRKCGVEFRDPNE